MERSAHLLRSPLSDLIYRSLYERPLFLIVFNHPPSSPQHRRLKLKRLCLRTICLHRNTTTSCSITSQASSGTASGTGVASMMLPPQGGRVTWPLTRSFSLPQKFRAHAQVYVSICTCTCSFNRAPRRPTRAPIRSKSAPRRPSELQEGPIEFQNTPSEHQDAPSEPQDAPSFSFTNSKNGTNH
jgi:hypothetical protein